MFSKATLATLVPIRNMNRAIKFYTKSLGGKLQDRARGAMKNFWASIKVGKEDFWLIAPEKREKRTLAYSTFLVRNIKGVVKELQRKGVKFERGEGMSKESRVEGPIVYESFGASAFFKDSEGNLFMVWQNDPPM
jgi:predicted enzyme related to lactoylglutathione lyase